MSRQIKFGSHERPARARLNGSRRPADPRARGGRRRRNRAGRRPLNGRALHLVDVENLSRGPFTGIARESLAAYLAAADWREGDHVVVAGHPRSVLEAGLAIGVPCRLLPAHGHDGGDRALLAATDVSFVAARFDRIVIGSGDGIFAHLAEEFAAHGLDVWVVAPSGGLSMRLNVMSNRVVMLADPRQACE